MKRIQRRFVLIFALAILLILIFVNLRPGFYNKSLSLFTEEVTHTNQNIKAVKYRMINTTFFMMLEMKTPIEEKEQVQFVKTVGDQFLQSRVFGELMTYNTKVLNRPGINIIAVELKSNDIITKYGIVLEKYLAVNDSEVKFRIESIERINQRTGVVETLIKY